MFSLNGFQKALNVASIYALIRCALSRMTIASSRDRHQRSIPGLLGHAKLTQLRIFSQIYRLTRGKTYSTFLMFAHIYVA